MSVLLAYNLYPFFKHSHLSTEALIFKKKKNTVSLMFLSLGTCCSLKKQRSRAKNSSFQVFSFFHAISLLQFYFKDLPNIQSFPFSSQHCIMKNFKHETPMYIHPDLYPPSRFYNEDFAVFTSYLPVSSYLLFIPLIHLIF